MEDAYTKPFAEGPSRECVFCMRQAKVEFWRVYNVVPNIITATCDECGMFLSLPNETFLKPIELARISKWANEIEAKDADAASLPLAWKMLRRGAFVGVCRADTAEGAIEIYEFKNNVHVQGWEFNSEKLTIWIDGVQKRIPVSE